MWEKIVSAACKNGLGLTLIKRLYLYLVWDRKEQDVRERKRNTLLKEPHTNPQVYKNSLIFFLTIN